MKKSEIESLLIKWGIENYNVSQSGVVDVDGDVSLKMAFEVKKSGIIPFKFGKITGSFNCSYCMLKNLINSPDFVGGDFDCSRNYIINFVNSPKTIGGAFIAHSNKKLQSMDGITASITDLDISNCNLGFVALANVKISGHINASYNMIKGLNNFPEGAKSIDVSKNLVSSMHGAPKNCVIDVSGNPIQPEDDLERSTWG